MRPAEEGLYEATVRPAASDARLQYSIEAEAGGRQAVTEPVEVIVTEDATPPKAEIDRVAKATPGTPLRISV